MTGFSISWCLIKNFWVLFILRPGRLRSLFGKFYNYCAYMPKNVCRCTSKAARRYKVVTLSDWKKNEVHLYIFNLPITDYNSGLFFCEVDDGSHSCLTKKYISRYQTNIIASKNCGSWLGKNINWCSCFSKLLFLYF